MFQHMLQQIKKLMEKGKLRLKWCLVVSGKVFRQGLAITEKKVKVPHICNCIPCMTNSKVRGETLSL